MDNGSGQQSSRKPVRLVYYRKTVARVIGKKKHYSQSIHGGGGGGSGMQHPS